MKMRFPKAVVLVALISLSSGCVAVKVVDTVASTAIGVTKVATKVAVKGAVGVAKVVIPGDSDKKKKKK